MLFNKANNGAVELRDRTGSYYSNNKFDRIATDVMLAEHAMIKLVGQDVYDRAHDHYRGNDYQTSNPNAAQKLNDELVLMMQIPIAYRATYNYYQSNIVSHEDAGRKLKLDPENEKVPWEWMLDRDDRAQVSKGNKTTDMLISWLEEKKIPEWLGSQNRKIARELFVWNEEIFQDAYPIDQSPRFFYTTLAWNKEVQEREIKKALGNKYTDLLAYHIGLNEGSGSGLAGIPSVNNGELEELLKLVQKAIPLLVMVKAVKRLSLQVLPEGVVQQFMSETEGRGASQAALLEVIKYQVKRLEDDASDIFNDVKLWLQQADPSSREFQLLPNNKDTDKFFRT
jgi:hypothetical protein